MPCAIHNTTVARVWRPAVPMPAQRLVIIGSSTGGPQALTTVVPQLPATLDAGVVIVQHMPPGFTTSLAARLNDLSPLVIHEAADNDLITTGQALLAPGDYHLRIVVDAAGFRVRLDQGPRVLGMRPAVDITLESAVAVTQHHICCAILTGMGHDGTAGATRVRAAGGWVIAQNKATCVIYGMPRSVIEAGQASEILPLQEIAAAIIAQLALGSGPGTGVSSSAPCTYPRRSP